MTLGPQFGESAKKGYSYWKRSSPTGYLDMYSAVNETPVDSTVDTHWERSSDGNFEETRHTSHAHPQAALHVYPGHFANHFDSQSLGNPFLTIASEHQIFPEDEQVDGATQGRLFSSVPAQISYMRADSSMGARLASMNLLGVAIQDHQRSGHGIVPDSSLSVHSSPLAKRGLKEGILGKNSTNPTAKKNKRDGVRTIPPMGKRPG